MGKFREDRPTELLRLFGVASVQDVAQFLGLSVSTVSEWKAVPSAHVMALAKKYKIDPENLSPAFQGVRRAKGV